MITINLLSYMNFSSPRIGCLRFWTRCISACFAGVRPTCADARLGTLKNHCINQQSFTSKNSRTLSMENYENKVFQRGKNVNCFFILSALKDFSRWTSTHQVLKFSFSSRGVSLLPDELTEKKHDVEKKNVLHKDKNKSTRKFGPHEYEFDADGYLPVDDVVKFLTHEAGFDICVVETSGAKRAYVDYFIVVCGVSNRHIRAMSKNLEQLFRGHHVRGISKQGHVTVEGLESDSNWLAVDIGNMVVHFFLPEFRQLYELEKLWTLGPKYDDQYKAMLEEEEFLQAVFLGEPTKKTDQEK